VIATGFSRIRTRQAAEAPKLEYAPAPPPQPLPKPEFGGEDVDDINIPAFLRNRI
jgi:hypothetical protein